MDKADAIRLMLRHASGIAGEFSGSKREDDEIMAKTEEALRVLGVTEQELQIYWETRYD